MEGENEVGLSVPDQKIYRKPKVLSGLGRKQDIVGPLCPEKGRKEKGVLGKRKVIDMVNDTFLFRCLTEKSDLCG